MSNTISSNAGTNNAGIAQLGERQTEDLKVACSIHAHRKTLHQYRLFSVLTTRVRPFLMGFHFIIREFGPTCMRLQALRSPYSLEIVLLMDI